MDNHKLLIIENDEDSAKELQISLQKQGYEVEILVRDLTKAKRKIKTYMPDIILIDVLQEESTEWMEVVHSISRAQIPFIVLTAFADTDTIKRISKIEPCGYFVKPFNPLNLHVTIQISFYKFTQDKNRKKSLEALKVDNQNLKKLLFAKERSDKPIISFGDGFSFNTNVCETFYKNKKVNLTRKENLFIQLLVSNIGNTVNFQQAINYLWGKAKASENNVRTLVWRLRSKMDSNAIKTVSGVGYYIEKTYTSVQNKSKTPILNQYKEVKDSA